MRQASSSIFFVTLGTTGVDGSGTPPCRGRIESDTLCRPIWTSSVSAARRPSRDRDRTPPESLATQCPVLGYGAAIQWGTREAWSHLASLSVPSSPACGALDQGPSVLLPAWYRFRPLHAAPTSLFRAGTEDQSISAGEGSFLSEVPGHSPNLDFFNGDTSTLLRHHPRRHGSASVCL